MPKLLILDDDPVFARYVSEVATKSGWTSKICGNSTKAVDIALSYSPDVIFVDMIMPERDGLEILQDLSAKMPAVQVIVVTMFDSIYLTMAERLLKSKFEKPVISAQKPLNPSDIEDLLRRTSIEK